MKNKRLRGSQTCTVESALAPRTLRQERQGVFELLWQYRIKKRLMLLLFLVTGSSESKKASMLLSLLSDFQLTLQSFKLVLTDSTVVKLFKNDKSYSSPIVFFFYDCQFRKIYFWNGSMRNTFLYWNCHFLLPWQLKTWKASYELPPKITTNSTKEKSVAFYCQGDS